MARSSAIITLAVFCLALVFCGLVAWIVYRPASVQIHPEPGHDRYALVMVAAHYRSLPSRPDYVAHARQVAQHAQDAGYALIGGGVIIDPTEHQLRRSVDVLGRLTEAGAESLVYFAGHAVPGDNTIFLLATDTGPLPLTRFAEGGIRLEEIWSHPLGSSPSKTTILIETRGMGGLFSGGLTSFGTGLDMFEAPPEVTIAISDRDGPVRVSREALHRTTPVRPGLVPDAWRSHPGQEVLFTPALVTLRALENPDLINSLAEVSLAVHEQSSSQISPVIFGQSVLAAAMPRRYASPALRGLLETRRDATGDQAENGPAPDPPAEQVTAVIPEQFLEPDSDAQAEPPPAVAGDSRTGQSVIELIRMFEAFRADTYLDEAGVPTIGYGHTGPDARPGNTISYERAVQLLMRDIDIAARAVDEAVTRELTDNQRNALISLTFNIGAEAFRNSTLVRRINSDIESVSAAQFLRWVHARVPGSGMQSLSGLVSRRQMEAFLFLVQDEGVDALELILSFEPFRESAARVNDCSVIGYGRVLLPCDQVFDVQISQVEALQLLRREARAIESEIRTLVGVPVSDAQMAALISFVHQNGLEALTRSRILARLNRGDHMGAANAMRLHNAFLGGPAMQVGASQIERRAAEAALFFAHGGDYVVTPAGAAT
ncbi:glycoside hydrolase family protein [Alkalicaulis satelles]|uniref:Lysozyme n=1 Tax=Alkalicaulis satelles TaxID=2609175 RepID=A0A5M6ZHM3_9PROT|nr:glycoside hydrolase family protein [Alkalicaulis satelles]KAA5801731.1 glycoside hydrolase family protein [Alkalicaulis satelles]